MCLITLSSHFINFCLNFGLGFVQLTKLCIELLNGSLSFSQSCLKLHFAHFHFFSFSKTIIFIFGPPQISFLHCLLQLMLDICSGTRFLLQIVFYSIKLMFKIFKFAKQRMSFSSLIICYPFLFY